MKFTRLLTALAVAGTLAAVTLSPAAALDFTKGQLSYSTGMSFGNTYASHFEVLNKEETNGYSQQLNYDIPFSTESQWQLGLNASYNYVLADLPETSSTQLSQRQVFVAPGLNYKVKCGALSITNGVYVGAGINSEEHIGSKTLITRTQDTGIGLAYKLRLQVDRIGLDFTATALGNTATTAASVSFYF